MYLTYVGIMHSYCVSASLLCSTQPCGVPDLLKKKNLKENGWVEKKNNKKDRKRKRETERKGEKEPPLKYRLSDLLG